MSEISPTTLIAAATVGGLVVHHSLSFVRGKKLPPGPRRLPVIGNAHQLPTETPWIVFREWGKIYGDIFHVDLMGQSLIIINSAKVAKELLDKRSSIYSDRPHFVFAGELVHYDEPFVLQPYGDNWRTQRRMITQDFSGAMMPRYYGLQEKEAAILVQNLLDDPSKLVSQVKLTLGTIIIRVTYGYQIKSSEDPMLTIPLAAMDDFSVATTPGNFMVDFIPALKHLPRWMPGSGFLKIAEEYKKRLDGGTSNAFKWCKKNMDTGETLMPNLCGTYFQEHAGKMSADEEEKLRYAASTVMGGGMDTNMSSVITFWMAMILNPGIQAKAQAELDAVIGQERLPSITDKPDLPYIRSIMAETFRWSPPIPLCIPHALTQDDVYEGYDIPKGSTIIPNIWAMLHDPEVYADPMEFNPERFKGLDSEMKKVTDLTFGFGRRVCPGIHFAEGAFFAIITTVLATCDILPGLDAEGKEVLPKYEYTSGTIVFPKPFTMRLRPRSARSHSLLAEVSSLAE